MATPPPRRRKRPSQQARGPDAAEPAAAPVFQPVAEKRSKKGLPIAPRPGEEHVVHAPRPGRFPREALAPLILLTIAAYVGGWYIAYTGLLPLFLASDIGLVTLITLGLRTTGRVVRSRVPSDGLAIPAAALSKAIGWGIGTFWFFLALTNAWQLSVGVGGGIVLYQMFATRARLRREGFGHATRFGPAFGPALLLAVFYLTWYGARSLFGSLDGFDVASALLGAAVVFMAIRWTDRASLAAAGTLPRVHDDDPTSVRRDLERRVIIAVVFGYLFFRVFISTAIPYGPIVEWLLVCIGALFIAIIMADRIGTVSTRRSLPAHDVRVHIQRILALPDRDLETDEEHVSAFIQRGIGADWLHERFSALFEEADIPHAERERLLEPLRAPTGRKRAHAPAESYGLEARERLVGDLVGALRGKRIAGATGTLKSDPPLRSDDTSVPPGVTPTATPGG